MLAPAFVGGCRYEHELEEAQLGVMEAHSVDVLRECRRVAEEIASHYGVEVARVQHDRCGDVRCLGHFGPHSTYQVPPRSAGRAPSSLELFRHHVHRDLPIIVEDAMETGQEACLVLDGEQFAFYASAPIVGGVAGRCGTVNMLSRAGRPGFSLGDCKFLEEKAAEIARILSISSLEEPVARRDSEELCRRPRQRRRTPSSLAAFAASAKP